MNAPTQKRPEPVRPSGPAAQRRNAERLGRRAEALAAIAYALRGFSVIARRFQCRAGEIDLILRRSGLIVLAEVKARGNADDAIFAVDERSRRRIERAGEVFLAGRPELAAGAVRYDIVAVVGWRAQIVADAWRAR